MSTVENLFEYDDVDFGYCADCGSDDWKMVMSKGTGETISGFCCKYCKELIYLEGVSDSEIVVELGDV